MDCAQRDDAHEARERLRRARGWQVWRRGRAANRALNDEAVLLGSPTKMIMTMAFVPF